MSFCEGGRGGGGAGLTTRSLLPTPVNTRPPRNHVAEPLPHRTNTTTLPQNTTQHARNRLYTKKNENQKNHETEKNNRTYLDIAKTAIQQTNQPTPALTLSSNTHIKFAALVIGAHIVSLAKIESYGSILSKSLKRNFNIDTSFPDKDSQIDYILETRHDTEKKLLLNSACKKDPKSVGKPFTF
ncbi:hypothetical protein FHG87_019102 [Trinorchestia longiramus]|nr:hypothetical protein FHG87_019102 [Trinorchestia longiramus]